MSEENNQEFDVSSIPADVIDQFKQQGRLEAVNTIRAQAANAGLENASDLKPGQIVKQFAAQTQELSAQLEELRGQITDTQKGAKKQVDDTQAQTRELEAKLAEQYRAKEEQLMKNAALTGKMADIISIAKRDYALTDEGAGIYEAMLKQEFDFEVIKNGEQYNVAFRKKGADTDFYVGDQPAGSKELAKAIQEKYPGMHTVIPAGLGSKGKSGVSETRKSTTNLDWGNLLNRDAMREAFSDPS